MTKWRGAVRGLLRPWWICLRGFGGISKIYLFFFYNIVCGVFSKCISLLKAQLIHTKLSTLRFEYITAPAGSFYEKSGAFKKKISIKFIKNSIID
ncbi:MAG: hypothetical protein PHO78_09300 [Methanomicrobium sp.]|nr:hypothetical protein [Methanomicrobium sp.]